MPIDNKPAQRKPTRITPAASQLAGELTERFGPLLTQSQLAELLGRSAGGLRYSLCMPSDASTRALKACGRKIGRRVYYPATEVAQIISSDVEDE